MWGCSFPARSQCTSVPLTAFPHEPSVSAVHFSPGELGTLPTSDPPVEPGSSPHHFHSTEEEVGLERGRTARDHVRLWMLGSIPAALASTLFPLHLCTAEFSTLHLCTAKLSTTALATVSGGLQICRGRAGEGRRVNFDPISVPAFSPTCLIEGLLLVSVLQWTSTHFALSWKVFRKPPGVGLMGVFLPEGVLFPL